MNIQNQYSSVEVGGYDVALKRSADGVFRQSRAAFRKTTYPKLKTQLTPAQLDSRVQDVLEEQKIF